MNRERILPMLQPASSISVKTRRRLYAALVACVLAMLAWPASANAASGAAPNSQQRRVLSKTHTDAIAVFAESGGLTLATKADVDGTLGVRLDPNLTAFNVEETTRTKVPAAASYAFLGVAGSDIWLAPESNPGGTRLWPGFSTEGVPAGLVDGNQLTLRLESVTGPGTLHIFQSTAFGEPSRLFSSTGSVYRAWNLPRGTHAHANWAFSAPGAYTLTFSVSAMTKGVSITATQNYAFVVGDVPPPVPTTTAFAVGTNSTVQGNALLLSAVVAPTNATGYVEFLDGSTILGHASVSAGSAALTTTNLALGTRSVTARFVPLWLNDFSASTSTATSITVTDPAGVPFSIAGIVPSYRPGEIMQARIAGVTPGEGQEIQWRMRPVGTDHTGTVLGRFVLPELNNPESRAGRLDMRLDASYDGYELQAAVVKGDQTFGTTLWVPVKVLDAVEPLSLSYVGPTPFRIGDTALLAANGRTLAPGETLRIALSPGLPHYSLWFIPRGGFNSITPRTFQFEPSGQALLPLALQVVRDGLVVAQSEPLIVDAARAEFFFEGMQPLYRVGQTFSASIRIVPDLGDKVTYSWAMYDNYQNPMKVAKGESGRTFEMPVTADMNGKRMFIQANVIYPSGNVGLVGGAYPYLTVTTNTTQLFLFSSLPSHYHQGDSINLTLTADPGLAAGDLVFWEWRWPGTDWATLPGANGLGHQLTAEQAMEGLEVRATLRFGHTNLALLAGPVTVHIDDHGILANQQPTIAGAGSFAPGQQVTLTRQLPANGPTILTTHRWERKGAGESSFTTVAGQTASTLSLSSALADNGAQYRVSILKPDGTVAYGPSPAVTLTVARGILVRATFDKSAAIKSVDDLVDTRLADIDKDGDLDVLYAKRITAISILPNNGKGTFGEEIALPALTTSEIHVADMNGDDLPDIVSSVYLDSTYAETAIAIWRNLGAGSFSGMELVESTRTTGYVFLTGVGDVDKDGLNDLVFEANGHSWSRNQGAGRFGPRVTISIGGGVNYSAVLKDVDQDGDPDIVQASLENDVFTLRLYRNSGTATPSFTAEQLASFGSMAIGDIAIGDTTQDGFADIHLIRRNSIGEILILKGTATGAFEAPIILGSGPDLTELQIGDIDGDGRPDLALSARDRNQILFAQNLGAGMFTKLQEFTSDGAYLNPGPEYVAVGDIDGDGRKDLVYGERFGDRVAWSRNRSEENLTALTPPASRTYLNGYPMTFDVFLGFNIEVNTTGGSPTLPVTIGSQVVPVPFAGQPNANVLRFRYQVQGSDLDVDGITVATAVALNGATLTDVHGRSIDLALVQFPAVDTSGILVNGGAPYVTGISRLDANPPTSPSVRFEVAFSEPVTGVTVDDFKLDASGPTGAAITAVTGSGSSYVVTTSTGSGDGTLRLRVLDDDSIFDGSSFPLGGAGLGSGEFAYGQGYTIRRSIADPTFNNVITDGHLDVSLLLYEGVWYPYWNGVGFWDTTDTILSAGPDARATRPADSKWNFLGAAAGETVWVFPEAQSDTTPWPGVGAYDNQVGAFASYFETDPRVNATAAWLKMQLMDVRGPEGGKFSLYQSGIADPIVFMTTADGVGPEDVAWIPNLDHIHYNWAFTKPGLYQVDVVASAYIDFNQTGTYEPGVDPLSESQIITLYFGIELKPTITGAGSFAAGQTVTLTRQLPAGVATPFTVHLWERKAAGAANFVAMAGATNAVLAFQAALADAGSEYRVSILKPEGTVAYGPSPAVTLTVSGPRLVPFAAARTLDTAAGAYPVRLHDLNGDGRLDVLTGAYGNNTVAWHASLGGGEFGPRRVISDQVTDLFHVDAGDIDGDGDLDVLAGGDAVTVYRNLGGGTFGPAILLTEALDDVRWVGLGDVNGDGKADAIVAAFGGSTVAVFRSNGDGTFAPQETITTASIRPRFGAMGDLDGDGDMDLVVTSTPVGAFEVSWYANNGAGVFGPKQVLNGDAARVRGVKVADLNADGRPDVLAALETRVVWLENLGGGTFAPARAVLEPISAAFDLAVSDLNGDNVPDVVATGVTADQLLWAQNLGGGVFGAPQLIYQEQGGTTFVAAGDLDGDGLADLVTGDQNGRFAYFENRLGRGAVALFTPPDGTYVAGSALEFTYHVGLQLAVNGIPRLPLVIGSKTGFANYVGGAGSSALRFRYTVVETDLDHDGIELGGTTLDLNGGAITLPDASPAPVGLPAAALSGIRVNGSAPLVASITRLDPNPTNAGRVRFQVRFTEAVVGVSAEDFAMVADGVAGAQVTGATGSGAEYIVMARTGSGAGTVGLRVLAGASIADTAGNTLGAGFLGGQVYTLARRPERTIDEFYTQGHGDLGIGYSDGNWELTVGVDSLGDLAPDEVLIYGGPEGLQNTPQGPEWAFLGAASRVYAWPASATNPAVPELGISAEGIPPGKFASYFEADPRVDFAGPFIKLQAVGFRGPVGGQFSVYSSGVEGPTVFLSTANGLDSTDALFVFAGSHVHYNFAFSVPGVYEVDMVASGYLDANGNGTYDPGIDPYTESGVVTYYFGIDLPSGKQPYTIPADPIPAKDLALTVANGTATLSITTQPGRVYRLESAPALTGPWADVGDPISGTGQVVPVVVPVSGPTGFFRWRTVDAP